MIPRKLEEWNGFYGTDYKKGLKKSFTGRAKHQMLERKEKQLPIETVRLFSFYSFHCFTRCSSSQHIYHQCLKSMSFFYFSRNHLLVTTEIIYGRGPFAVWGSSAAGDHLRYCTVGGMCCPG